jgi:hypothetical protein
LGSPDEPEEQPVVPATVTLSGVPIPPNEQIVPPPGVTGHPDESTQPPPAVTTVSNESTVPLSQTATPAPKTGAPSSRERCAPLLNPVRPMPDHNLNRDFWGEAVAMLPKEYKFPEEWRAATIDRESVVGMVKAKMEECEDEQWKIKINGEVVTVREIFGKTLDWIQKLPAVGDAAVQYDPAHAALPWAGFRFLLQVRHFRRFLFTP